MLIKSITHDVICVVAAVSNYNKHNSSFVIKIKYNASTRLVTGESAIQIRNTKLGDKTNYEIPDRLEGRDEELDPMLKLTLLKLRTFEDDVLLAAAADICEATLVTLPANPIHFSWVFLWHAPHINRGASPIHLA